MERTIEEMLIEIVNAFVGGDDLAEFPRHELLIVGYKIHETTDPELQKLHAAINEAYPRAKSIKKSV